MKQRLHPRTSRWLVGAGLSASLVLSRPAFAEPETSTQATAVALFDEARQLMKDGRNEEACPKLQESQRLSPGIGTLYNLADCYEKIGRTASAWLRFREVVARSSGAGQMERAEAARKRVDAVEPRLCRVRISILDATSDLTVELDGAPASSATWSTAVPVDPGTHVVRASAPGHEPWEGSLQVTKEGATVTFKVPRLRPDDAPRAPVAGAPTGAASGPPQDGGAAPSPGTPWQVPVGITSMGLGVVALGVGTAVGFAAKSTADDADCDAQDVCSQAGVDDRASAVTQGNVATVVFIAGGAVVLGGLTLWLTAPSTESASGASRGAGPAVGVAPRLGGASIVGEF